MLRSWFKEGIEDGEKFRRRIRWAMAIQWLVALGAVISILSTYSP